MRLIPFVIIGTLLALALEAPAQSTGMPQPIFSRDRSFRIPFAAHPGLKEVQLAVSTDRGATWRQCATSTATEGQNFFTFTAHADGEHWFTPRTVDFEGRTTPPSLNGALPQIIVVVDTTPPTVELRGLSPSIDEIGIKWSIHDENLDMNTMRVEFRAGSNDWFPVRVQQIPEGSSRFRPGTRGPIELRLRVLDRAGNEAVEQISLQSPGNAAAPNYQPSPASTSPSGGIQAFGSQPTPAPPAQPYQQPNMGSPTGSTFTPNPGSGFSVPPPPDVRNPLGSPATGSAQAMPLGPPSTATAPYGSGAQGGMYGTPDQSQGYPVNPPTNQAYPAPDPRPGVVDRTRPSYGQEQEGPQARFVSSPATPPVRTNLQLVNSTSFQINYEIEEIGKSGIGSIALYWTHDGSTWTYNGDDEDQKSPFNVEVEGEGTFGFKLIGRSKAGLGDDPPRPGDPADVWVEVDITPPQIDLRPPQPGRGASSGVLDIQWDARDKNPAPKPISLYYSQEASGPWKPIAEGIENSGRYQWHMPDDPSMPYQFFVRIECRDRAGNVGRTDTPTAVIVDLTRPKLRVLRVEPMGQPADLALEPEKPKPAETPEHATPDLGIGPLPE